MIDPVLYDLIEYFEDCIYDAYVYLDVNTEDIFDKLQNKAVEEAMDDIRTEPMIIHNYDLDYVMGLAIKKCSFKDYINYRTLHF
jgi:cyanate lyase